MEHNIALEYSIALEYLTDKNIIIAGELPSEKDRLVDFLISSNSECSSSLKTKSYSTESNYIRCTDTSGKWIQTNYSKGSKEDISLKKAIEVIESISIKPEVVKTIDPTFVIRKLRSLNIKIEYPSFAYTIIEYLQKHGERLLTKSRSDIGYLRYSGSGWGIAETPFLTLEIVSADVALDIIKSGVAMEPIDGVNDSSTVKGNVYNLNDGVISDLPEPAIWKNPKPKRKNQRDIEVGQLVLIDGEEVLQNVTSVNGSMVTVEGTKYPITDVYPMYRKQSNNLFDIGNIIVYLTESNDTNSAVVTGIDNNMVVTTTDSSIKGEFIKVRFEDVLQIWALTPEPIIYKKFSCGKLAIGSVTYDSLEEMKLVNDGFKLKETIVDSPYEVIAIAQHYNIDVDEVTSAESHIMSDIKTALEHPLNVNEKEWALIWGPSGSGKSRVCVDYAKNKGQKFIKQQGSAQLTVDDFTGFKSITTGEYFPSLLRKAVENGYLYMLDEIDACNPNTLLVLNGLKQDEFQFPDELIPVHKDFRLVATANTLEFDEEYNARTKMDKATLARFKDIEYVMQPHELAIRYGIDHIKNIKNIEQKTPREISREVIELRISNGE